MNRKHFLASTGILLGGMALPVSKSMAAGFATAAPAHKVPPYLKTGDTIGITTPAGFSTIEEVQAAIPLLASWGFKIKIGGSIGKKEFNYGGTDEERRADFQSMLDDPSVKAILCARGGYGVVRIIDQLKWSKFLQQPKWVIGFSDITVLHNHIHTVCNVASIHSKMINSFPANMETAEPPIADTILSIRDALTGAKMKYTAVPNAENRLGKADGALVGGNLSILETLAGTASDINTDGKILFVEDTGEYLYSIDRMFWNLKRTGKLKALKGLIVGGFKIKPDDPGEEFGSTLQQIVLDKIKQYNYPVCFDFPVGHQRANYALKCGVIHKLVVDQNQVTLTEKA